MFSTETKPYIFIMNNQMIFANEELD